MEELYLWKAVYRIPEESESASHSLLILTKSEDKEAARKTAVSAIRGKYINPEYDVFTLSYITFLDVVYQESGAK